MTFLPVRVTLELSEWQMLLEMFAIIDSNNPLGGDMLKLYEHLREQLRGVLA